MTSTAASIMSVLTVPFVNLASALSGMLNAKWTLRSGSPLASAFALSACSLRPANRASQLLARISSDIRLEAVMSSLG